MNIKKYLNKMAVYLSVDKRKCANKKDCIKKIVKTLKEREKKLGKKLESEKNDAQRQELATKIKILHKKREKGLHALRKLKKRKK